jgi:PAS domain S-box-containing protein
MTILMRDPAWVGPGVRRILPWMILACALLIEAVTPGVRVTPSLLTIGLAVLSLFLPPRRIVLWAVVMFCPVLWTLLFVSNAGVPDPATVVVLRSLAYVVFALMAYSLSSHRENTEHQVRDLVNLFDSIRTPIVVSDVDGNINFANLACCELLGTSLQDIKDSTFFSLFAHPEQRGKSIEQYLAHFENSPDGAIEMTLSIRGSERSFKSVGSIMELDGRKLLVSQLF